MLFSPILRKLVNESNGTFISLQKAAETAKNSDSQVELLKLSRQYRSIIRVCIESLQDASNKATDGIEKNNYLSQITIFYSVECIWHLCEILFIDNIPGDVVLPFLMEWVRFHSPSHEQSAAQLLEACERGSETHPEYWDTVIGMVVQGRVDVARALLKLHSAVDSNEFKLVDNSLRSMPTYNVSVSYVFKLLFSEENPLQTLEKRILATIVLTIVTVINCFATHYSTMCMNCRCMEAYRQANSQSAGNTGRLSAAQS